MGVRFGARARPLRYALYALAGAHVLEALFLRHRRRQLRVLAEPPAALGQAHHGLPVDVDVVAGAGVTINPATVAAVTHEMADSGSDVVDLVPGDLPAARALRLLRRVDTDRLGRDPLYSPGGAHVAVVVRRSAAERLAQRPDGAGRPARPVGLPDLVRFTRLAQRHAPTSSTLWVAPRLTAAPAGPADRWHELDEITAYSRGHDGAFILLAIESAHLAAITLGVLAAPLAGGAALVSWCLQPALVFAGGLREKGGAWRPAGLARDTVGRLPRAWRENLGAIRVGRRRSRQERKARPTDAVIARPSDVELFESPRVSCPWCDSSRLSEVLTVDDQVGQEKPGTFRLTECGDCRHVFQNPALSLQGLDYYYDQAYEGAGEESSDLVFGSLGRIDERRLRAIAQFTEPRAWLDVGTGYGHFPVVARQRWPEATFDGLDIGGSVEEAQRRGWIDTAYRGLFPDLADGLPRSYDVVSMHHYLEHTREPKRELAAASKVLESGGYLMIEVPDPDCFWSRRLGPFWLPWFQPQHQHFIPCENLVEALDSSGFEVVSVERGAANMVWLDLASGAGLATRTLAGHADAPWRPASDAAHPVRRVAVGAAATPVMVAAGVADVAWDLWLRHLAPERPGNTYRVVARRV